MSDPDNEGHPGRRITGIAGNVLTRHRPDVVTVEIGTNDLNQISRSRRPPTDCTP